MASTKSSTSHLLPLPSHPIPPIRHSTEPWVPSIYVPMADQRTSPIFINSILKPGKTRPILVAQTVDVGAQRQIRRHKKSRRGCIGCKIRKVKCDERQPCGSCLKRGIACISPPNNETAVGQARHIIVPGLGMTPQMSLLQLELFHHWDRHTRSTLVYPEIWSVVMQHAINEHFVMASVLCTSAMHLSTLHPQSRKYSDLASWLMPRALSLFRQGLSRPLTKTNAESIVGAALLINYVCWFDLSFLQGSINTIDALVQDPLLLVSSGITHAWFQTIPVLIEGNSIFLKIMTRHPRLVIEQALAPEHSANLAEQPLMDMWDDPRYHTSRSLAPSTTVHEPASNRSWRLLQGLESELLPANSLPKQNFGQCPEPERLQKYKLEVTKITSNSMSTGNPLPSSETRSSSQAQASFAYVVRRISPLICCQYVSSSSNAEALSNLAAIQDDIEQLIYGFPILLCGPFSSLIQQGDSRALVLLLQLYRSAQILLDTERCWWARARTSNMEHLITSELMLRGLSTRVEKLDHNDADCRSSCLRPVFEQEVREENIAI